MAHSVRAIAEDLIREYDEGEDIKGAIGELSRTLESGPTYVTEHDRFVVTMELGLDADDVYGALDIALADLRDDGPGSGDTQWVVLDRRTGESHIVEQREVS